MPLANGVLHFDVDRKAVMFHGLEDFAKHNIKVRSESLAQASWDARIEVDEVEVDREPES